MPNNQALKTRANQKLVWLTASEKKKKTRKNCAMIYYGSYLIWQSNDLCSPTNNFLQFGNLLIHINVQVMVKPFFGKLFNVSMCGFMIKLTFKKRPYQRLRAKCRSQMPCARSRVETLYSSHKWSLKTFRGNDRAAQNPS